MLTREDPPASGLAVVMPVHNERDSVGSVIDELAETIIRKHGATLFVFEDGSRDGTGEVLRELAASRPFLRVATSSERKGYPRAVQDAILSVDPRAFPFLVFVDGDGQYDPREFEGLWARFRSGGAEVVLGSRTQRTEPAYRAVPSKVLRRLEGLLFDPGVRDVTSAFRVMRTDVAQEIASKVRHSRYNFWLEFTARAACLGYRQAEVPVSYRSRNGATKVYGLRRMPRILGSELRALVRTWIEYKAKEVVRFAAVGLSGAGVILLGTWLLTDLAGLYYVLSAGLSIEASVLWAFVLNDRWTFRAAPKTRSLPRRLAAYNVVSLAGTAINLSALFVLAGLGGIHYLLSEFLAIVVAFAFNYFASLRFAWRSRPAEAPG